MGVAGGYGVDFSPTGTGPAGVAAAVDARVDGAGDRGSGAGGQRCDRRELPRRPPGWDLWDQHKFQRAGFGGWTVDRDPGGGGLEPAWSLSRDRRHGSLDGAGRVPVDPGPSSCIRAGAGSCDEREARVVCSLKCFSRRRAPSPVSSSDRDARLRRRASAARWRGARPAPECPARTLAPADGRDQGRRARRP